MSDLEPAAIFPRLAAWIIDRLIVGSVWLLVACWGFVVYLSGSRWPPDLLSLLTLVGLVLLWGIGLHAAYVIVFVGGCGQTPGKMLLGIAVIRQDGDAPGYWRAVLRWIGSCLAALPLGLGFVPALFTAARRGFHDWISGTRVVHQRSV